MERAALTIPPSPAISFRDGIGERRHVLDPTGHETLDVLSLRSELAAVPSFEFALRERVSRLNSFRHPAYARVRAVERLSDRDATLTIVSDRVEGLRLSTILTNGEARGVALDINAALYLIRQLLPAIAALHENARDVAHGALGPERLVVTPDARLVVVEYVAGAALEQLRFSRERYWNELRIALPRTPGLSRFDHRADVMQIGVVALSLIQGSLLADDDYPSNVSDLVTSARAATAQGGRELLSSGLRAWLTRALQLDARSAFATAVEAQSDLDKVLADSEYVPTSSSLEQFLARYHSADSEPAEAPVRAAVVPPPPVVVAEVKSAPVLVAPAPHVPPPSPAPVPAPKPNPPELASLSSEVFDFVPEKPAAVEKPSVEYGKTHAASQPDERPSQTDEAETRGAGSKTSRGKAIGAAAAVLVLLAVSGLFARKYFASAPPAAAPTGTLVVNSSPEGAAVIVDGEARGKTPISLSLTPGAHQLDLLANGANRSIPVTITAGSEMSQYIELPKVASDKGQLQIRTEPVGAQISVDGTARGVSPTTVADLLPGEHTVLVTGSLGSVRQKVVVEAGVTASLFVPLAAPEGAPVSGWISVQAPLDVQLFENGQLLGTSASDRIMVSTGRHDVEIVSETLGYRATRTVQVTAGKVAPLKLDLPKGTLALNAVPWAEVWIDGEKQGDTPIGNVSLTIGPHDVVFRHPELGELHQTALVTLKGPGRLSVDLRKK